MLEYFWLRVREEPSGRGGEEAAGVGETGGGKVQVDLQQHQ